MKETSKKQSTIAAIDEMIRQADKGPSGFWVEDREGCGNPDIFPEFAEGLKTGRLVHKEHYLCPWNTAILYGSKRGNVSTGCYHSCSIKDARYLSKDMLVRILRSFKKRVQNGNLDNLENITPLLMQSDIEYIKAQKEAERIVEEKQRQKESREVRVQAADLLKKHPNYAGTIEANYGKKVVQMVDGGSIDFDPDGLSEVVTDKKLSYNDYLDAQINAIGKTHSAFQWCFYNIPLEFKGRIEKVSGGHICFQRVFVSGMYSDGECCDYSEQHVWMDVIGFEDLKPGDCVEFSADAYRYLKTGDGRQIDYGLRNPAGIKKIEEYELPSEDEILTQELRSMLCEACFLSEQCNRVTCTNRKWLNETLKSMKKTLKNNSDKPGETR